MSETLGSRILRLVESTPERICATIECGGRKEVVSYLELWMRSSAYAHLLRSDGVQEQETVLCIAEQSPELLYAFVGCVLCGCIPTVLAHPSSKLGDRQFRELLSTFCRVLQPSGALVSQRMLQSSRDILNRSPVLKSIISLGEGEYQQYTPSRSILNDSSRVALLQHSSGTTGAQKGIALSHCAVLNQIDAYWSSMEGNTDDKIASWLPLYHDMGLIAGFLLPLVIGVPLILLSPFEWITHPSSLLRVVTQYGATLSWMPNFAFNVLTQRVKDHELPSFDLRTWRAVVNCSEPVMLSSCVAFTKRFATCGLPRNAIVACYAMAENTFAVTQSPTGQDIAAEWIDDVVLRNTGIAESRPPGSATARAVVSCGRPIQGVSVRVLDPAGKTVAGRCVGEIAIRSPFLLSEYYKRPDLTVPAIVDGWFRTGDEGFLIEDQLYVCGRKKEVIIIAGVNYYPQDIESVVDGVQGVRRGRSVAIGIANQRTGTEDLVIIVELDVVDVQEQAQVKEVIRSAVTGATGCMVREVRIVPSGWLVKTSSGKISRSANRAKYETNGI